MITLRLVAMAKFTKKDVEQCMANLVNCVPEDERPATLKALEPVQDAGDGLWLIPARSKVESDLFYRMLIWASAKGYLNTTIPEPVDGFVVNIIRHRKDIRPSRLDRASL